jgi:hypothetical protein
MIKKLLREGIIKTNLTEDSIKLFETVKDYYTFSGNIQENIDALNELSVYLREEEDFDPYGHGDKPSEPTTDENVCLLKFSKSNTKLDWPSLSLPAGFTCPAATACKNFPAKMGKRFSDGSAVKKASEKTKFQCYAAREQGQYPSLNKNVFSNLNLLKDANKTGGVDGMANLIIESLENANFTSKIFRIHEGGDFFSNSYFQAWIKVCQKFPEITFYTHTTSLTFWINNKSSVPKNMNLIASMDEENYNTIVDNGLRYSKVVFSEEEAINERLPIDYDDSLACCTNKNFALLLHGQQPAGSEASKAVSKIKKQGIPDKLKGLHKANKSKRKELMRK